MARKPVIVKWTVDLFAPDAVISPMLTEWLQKTKQFHSRRCLFPACASIHDLMDIRGDGTKVLHDFAHIRVSCIEEDWGGVMDGDLDRMLARKTVDQVFDLPRVTGYSLAIAPAYQAGITKAGWIEMHEVDAGAETVEFVRLLALVDLFKLQIQE